MGEFPKLVFLRWDAEERKWLVEHYDISAKNAKGIYKSLCKQHGKKNIEIFISYEGIQLEVAEKKLRKLLK